MNHTLPLLIDKQTNRQTDPAALRTDEAVRGPTECASAPTATGPHVSSGRPKLGSVDIQRALRERRVGRFPPCDDRDLSSLRKLVVLLPSYIRNAPTRSNPSNPDQFSNSTEENLS